MPKKRYSTSKKEKLVERINELKTEKEYLELYEIIQGKNKKPTKQVGDSTVMFFHDLDNDTYIEIEKYLDKTLKKYEKKKDTESEYTEDYKPYSQDEFPDEKEISSKLKYSNKEKNLIKRKRYDQTLNEENGSDVVYCDFNIDNFSEKKD